MTNGWTDRIAILESKLDHMTIVADDWQRKWKVAQDEIHFLTRERDALEVELAEAKKEVTWSALREKILADKWSKENLELGIELEKARGRLAVMKEKIEYFEGDTLPEGMTRKALKEWLTNRGYDGLFTDDCGCELSDLCPCGGEYDLCHPGYKNGKNEFGHWIMQAVKKAGEEKENER